MPIETRKTRLDSGSGQPCAPTTTASTPNTSPIRTIVPRFSGLCSAGQITTVASRPFVRTRSARWGQGRRRPLANTPRWKLNPTSRLISARGTTNRGTSSGTRAAILGSCRSVISTETSGNGLSIRRLSSFSPSTTNVSPPRVRFVALRWR